MAAATISPTLSLISLAPSLAPSALEGFKSECLRALAKTHQFFARWFVLSVALIVAQIVAGMVGSATVDLLGCANVGDRRARVAGDSAIWQEI